MRRILLTLVVIIAIAAFLGVFSFTRHGVSARDEPTRIEVLLARSLRHWAVPSNLRSAKNPVPLTPQVLADGRAHFADHCALCHGNDGKGSDIGRQMYPHAPDMTATGTQSLSDGEIFAIIENGVRLTGMPAFGGGAGHDSSADTWALVHFIRHLPKITPEEVAAMEKLNPKSPEEWKEMEAESAFLSGDDHSH